MSYLCRLMLPVVLILLFISTLAMSEPHTGREIPIIDISPLWSQSVEVSADDGSSSIDRHSSASYISTVNSIARACTEVGFFYITGHGVEPELIDRMKRLSRKFFALPLEEKNTIDMAKGGKAWRGFFANGIELTSGLPDQKEGIYFGTELPDEGKPLHGPNQWIAGELGEEMKETVVKYMATMKKLGGTLMEAVAAGLEIDVEKFGNQFLNPTELFRIFNYPPHDDKFGAMSMGVGEHTDYGYLTILFQDDEVVDTEAGLQVRDLESNEWIQAPSIPGTFVINLGDALEHNTGGLLRATPHRYLQRRGAMASRLSFPYFYDPSFDAEMISIVPFLQGHWKERQEAVHSSRSRSSQERWDKKNPAQFEGKYGDYLLGKVSKVFPDLAKTESII
jgi:isopenicillin N synthase-like dioxygenase